MHVLRLGVSPHCCEVDVYAVCAGWLMVLLTAGKSSQTCSASSQLYWRVTCPVAREAGQALLQVTGRAAQAPLQLIARRTGPPGGLSYMKEGLTANPTALPGLFTFSVACNVVMIAPVADVQLCIAQSCIHRSVISSSWRCPKLYCLHLILQPMYSICLISQPMYSVSLILQG